MYQPWWICSKTDIGLGFQNQSWFTVLASDNILRFKFCQTDQKFSKILADQRLLKSPETIQPIVIQSELPWGFDQLMGLQRFLNIKGLYKAKSPNGQPNSTALRWDLLVSPIWSKNKGPFGQPSMLSWDFMVNPIAKGRGSLELALDPILGLHSQPASRIEGQGTCWFAIVELELHS